MSGSHSFPKSMKYGPGAPGGFPMNGKKYVGVLTSGGDTPGLNAALRGLGKASLQKEQSTVPISCIVFPNTLGKTPCHFMSI